MKCIEIDCRKGHETTLPDTSGYLKTSKRRIVCGAVPGEALAASPDAVLRVRTLEGYMEMRAGECMVMLGVRREAWPVKKAEFAKRYGPAEKGEALPPVPATPPAPGYEASVLDTASGRRTGAEELAGLASVVASRPGNAVKARRLGPDESASVTPSWSDKPLQGKPGDWIVAYAPGSFAVVEAEIFRETYETPRPAMPAWLGRKKDIAPEPPSQLQEQSPGC